MKFVPTKEELLATVGQPDKKRKRDQAIKDEDEAGKPAAKRVQKEEQTGPAEEVDITLSKAEESILVVNFGVSKEKEVKIAGFDMVRGTVS